MKFTVDDWDESQAISKIGSWSWEVSSNKVIWSKNMYRLLGLEPYELEPTYELAYHHVHASDKIEYEKNLKTAIENKTGYYFENRIARRDGLVLNVISRGRCILDKNEDLIQMVGTVQDITILKKLEKTRLEIRELEERDRMKTLICAVIAHDLYGELHTINFLSETLFTKSQNIDLGQIQKYSQIINKSSVQVRKILDSLYEWALIELDMNNFNPKLISPSGIIKDIVENNSLLNSKNVTIKNMIEPDQFIVADKNMLIVIIRNIISNAIKYSI